MKGKLKIVLPVFLLVVLGGVYKLVLAKPAPAHKPKIEGEVYVLPKEFLVNLKDERFAKVSVGLILGHGEQAAAGGGHGAAPKPPEGYGINPQEAVLRDIVTDELSNRTGDELISRNGREKLKGEIARAIKSSTDVPVEEVLFTDVAVQ
jgi:flagellar basal body-associated protein FliL